MALHNTIGELGEALASTHLESKGYTVLEKNWRYDRAEVDIITDYQGVIVFTEVKTRSSKHYGEPETFVTRKKQRQIIKAANAYMLENDINNDARFDVISILVTPNGDPLELKHIEDAFYPIA